MAEAARGGPPSVLDAAQDFAFANEVMALQRRHTTLAARRECDGLSYSEAAEAVRNRA